MPLVSSKISTAQLKGLLTSHLAFLFLRCYYWPNGPLKEVKLGALTFPQTSGWIMHP